MKWLIANIILKFIDISATAIIINTYGISSEKNPIIKFIIEQLSLYPGLIFILIAHIILIVLLSKKMGQWIYIVGAVIAGMAALINTSSLIIGFYFLN